MLLVNYSGPKYYGYAVLIVFLALCTEIFSECPITGSSWIRDEFNCSKYYACVHGRRITMPPCPNLTVYSISRHTCVWRNSHADDCTKETSTVKNHIESESMQKRFGVREFPSRRNLTHILHDLFVRTKTEPVINNGSKKPEYKIVKLSSSGMRNRNETAQSNYTKINNSRSEIIDEAYSDIEKQITNEDYYYYYYYYENEDSGNSEYDSDAQSWDYNNADYHENWSESEEDAEDSCGYSISPFIIGGVQATEGTWPWQVSLQVLTDPPSHRCGGVLVDPSWILTAAHCVYGTFNSPHIFQVVLADNDLINDSGFEVYRSVDEIISHPDYVPAGGYPNDIALVKLSAPVNPFENFVNTVCLPGQEETFDENDNCYITGWGETLGTGYRWVLNELATNIRTSTYCQTKWRRNFVEYSHLCVGNGETGACQGDSGGPLICARNGRMLVVGIASWAVVGCQREGYPNIFTKVSSYSGWIFSTIVSK